MNKKSDPSSKPSSPEKLVTTGETGLTKPLDPAIHLAAATEPLLEFFAEASEVFSDRVLNLPPEEMQKSFGRLWRAYKKARTALDPDYDPSKFKAQTRRRGE